MLGHFLAAQTNFVAAWLQAGHFQGVLIELVQDRRPAKNAGGFVGKERQGAVFLLESEAALFPL